MEELKKSSDDIAFFYGFKRVEKGDRSINIYDKNKYKAYEKGLLNAVAEEWHNILHDETTNILNFQEVLKERGVFTRIDTERKQIYFSNREITDTSKKVIGLYKIASAFNYQFGSANNVFDYDKSMRMLLKGTLEDEEIKSIEKKFNFKSIKKKEPELELELSNEKQSLEKQIQGYKESIKEMIEEKLKGYDSVPDNINITSKDREVIAEYNSILKSVKTRATAEYFEKTFKRSMRYVLIDEIMDSKIVKDHESTDFIVDRFFTMPSQYEINKIDSPRQLKKLKKNIEEDFKKITEEINTYIEQTPEFYNARKLKENKKYHFEMTDSILKYRKEQEEIEELKAKGLYKEPKVYYPSIDEITPKTKAIKSVEKKQEIRNYDIEYKEPDSTKSKKKEREI